MDAEYQSSEWGDHHWNNLLQLSLYKQDEEMALQYIQVLSLGQIVDAPENIVGSALTREALI